MESSVCRLFENIYITFLVPRQTKVSNARRASLKLVMGRVDCHYLIEVPLSPLPPQNAATFLSDRPCAKFLFLN